MSYEPKQENKVRLKLFLNAVKPLKPKDKK